MTAPSPGEWKLGDENCGGGNNIRAVVTTLDGDREELVIAWTSRVVRGGEVIVSDEEAKANALAITATKDMLAALKRADALLGHLMKTVPWGKTCQVDFAELNAVLCDLPRVIAKAEGRTS